MASGKLLLHFNCHTCFVLKMSRVVYLVIDHAGANGSVLESQHMHIVIVFVINIIVDYTWVWLSEIK